MKKSNAINLVLITAAMAACNRPLYQQRPEVYEDPGYSTGAPGGPITAGPGTRPATVPDSCLTAVPVAGLTADPDSGVPADAANATNSCPVESAALPPDYYDWYNGAGAFGSFTVDFNINGFYAYRNPAPLARVSPFRSFLTRTLANFPHPMVNHRALVSNRPASTHPTVARSGFGARVGTAVHS
jgi:hypothetical protein